MHDVRIIFGASKKPRVLSTGCNYQLQNRIIEYSKWLMSDQYNEICTQTLSFFLGWIKQKLAAQYTASPLPAAQEAGMVRPL